MAGLRLTFIGAAAGALLTAGGLWLWSKPETPAAPAAQSVPATPAPSAPPTREIAFTPTPAHVEPAEPVALDDSALPAFHGMRYLLHHNQVDLAGAEQSIYWRHVAHVSTAAAASNASQIHIPFNPSHHRIALHAIDIIRGGERQSREGRYSTDFLRRETALEFGVLSGVETALIRIEDMRAGDTLDISYSIIGDDPALASQHSHLFSLQHEFPIERLVVGGTWRRGEARLHTLGEAEPPQVRTRRGVERFSATIDAAAAFEPEPGAPAWTVSAPALLLTGFEDWRAVARWAAPYYALDDALPEEVANIAARLAAEHSGPYARMAAALEFVQDEIGYFAEVLGAGGYTPAPLSQTLRTRIGDCKAKTLLLLALFSELGIEAHPALVSVHFGRGLDALPASAAFMDHVIVQARVRDEIFWLDPTISFQRGVMHSRHQPDFGFALVLDGGDDGLQAMIPPAFTLFAAEFTETFDFRAGPRRRGLLEMETVYRAHNADMWRNLLANADTDDLARAYTAYYDRYLNGADMLGAFEIEDDALHNTLTLRARYLIGPSFTVDEAKNRVSRRFRAHNINRLLHSREPDRRSPVAVPHPVSVRHDIAVLLPRLEAGWSLESQSARIENEAFEFNYAVEYEGDDYLFMRFEQKSRAPFATLTEAMVKDEETMMEAAVYTVGMRISDAASIPGPDEDAPDAPSALLASDTTEHSDG